MKDEDIGFAPGYRKKAIEKAVELVKERGRSAQLVICRDIPGHHTGGEDCFCDPKTIYINVEDLQ